jgi:hypothetical protein
MDTSSENARLISRLKSIDPGRDPYGLQLLVEKLGGQKVREAVPLLIEILAKEGAQERMRPVMLALGEIGDPSAVEVLITTLQSKGDASQAAALALGYIGDARAIEPLIEALGYPKKWIRGCAAEALGKIGDIKAIEPLIALQSDEEEWVQDQAYAALVKLGYSETPGTVKWILESVIDQEEFQRLVDMNVLDSEMVERMYSRGVGKLVSSEKKTLSPETDQIVLTGAHVFCGVCGYDFDLDDPIKLCLRGPGDDASVHDFKCPSCGSENTITGHTTNSSNEGQESWVIAVMVSYHPKFEGASFLGWPALETKEVLVETI